MSELQRLIHNRNIRTNIHTEIIKNIKNEIKLMNFDIFINYFCEYKINYNNDIHIREYKYHLVDMNYPIQLRYNIIDNYLIFQIKNLLNFYFGYDNIELVYYFTEFKNIIIISFYLVCSNPDDLNFIIVN